MLGDYRRAGSPSFSFIILLGILPVTINCIITNTAFVHLLFILRSLFPRSVGADNRKDGHEDQSASR